MIRLYAISGLGADKRVFQALKLRARLIPIDWIEPNKHEDIKSYSKRLSSVINVSEPFGLIGVSFGGLIVKEMCSFLKPKIAIQVSSVELTSEIPLFYRFIGKTRLLEYLPTIFFKIPKTLANYFFGTRNKVLLNQIIDDSDPAFTKWALNQILCWKSLEDSKKILKIGGSKDRLLPIKDAQNTKIIKGGGHFMIIDKADEISKIINHELEIRKING